MSSYKLPSALEVDKTARLIEHKIVKTPVQLSPHLDRIATENARNAGVFPYTSADIRLFLKCENFQRTGSFKFRGASHFLTKLKDHELAKGVVAYSTGNHAQAVAHATQVESRERNMSIPTYVVVPSNCPAKKVTAAKSYGATVLFSGTAPEDRVTLANRIRQCTGAILVPSADNADIVLGQATAVCELLSQVGEVGEQLDAVVVPSGGGGLLVGAITVCKDQDVTVFAAEPQHGGPGLAAALETGQRTLMLDGTLTIADGLRSLTGEANWEHIRQPGHVNQVFTASEEQIKKALKIAIEEMGYLIEPSAAVALAVVLFSPEFAGRMAELKKTARVGVILTGGNVGVEDLVRMVPDIDPSILSDTARA